MLHVCVQCLCMLLPRLPDATRNCRQALFIGFKRLVTWRPTPSASCVSPTPVSAHDVVISSSPLPPGICLINAYLTQ